MASISQEAKLTSLAAYLAGTAEARTQAYKKAFEENRHRVYALAFWMTDNEMAAEELMSAAFCRAFAFSADPTAEMIDRALITEVRELIPVGVLTLECAPATEVHSVRTNTRRADLERAVVQLPATERMIFLLHDVERYEHTRIARILGIVEDESKQGLHQARLRLRELLARAS